MNKNWKASLLARAMRPTRPIRQKQKEGGRSKAEMPSNPGAAEKDRPCGASSAGATLQTEIETSSAVERSISPPQPFVLKFLSMTAQEFSAPTTTRATSEVVSETSVEATELKARSHAAGR